METRLFMYALSVGFAQSLSGSTTGLSNKPIIQGCIFYNWDILTCYWTQPENSTRPVFYYNATYIPVCRNSSEIPYVDVTMRGRVPENGLHRKTVSGYKTLYGCVKVDIRLPNKTIESSGWKKISMDKIVKPAPVKEVNVDAVNATFLKARWSPPVEIQKSENVTYRITYTSEWNNRSLNTSSSNLNLTGLIPNTLYTIDVNSIPSVQDLQKDSSVKYKNLGFWSDPVQVQNKTPEDVPGALPDVTSGAFYTLETSNSILYDLVIFWKKVERRLSHGAITKWRIVFTNLTTSYMGTITVEDRDSAILHTRVPGIYRNQSYSFCVIPHTSKGPNTSLSPTNFIIVAKEPERPGRPMNITAIANENKITLTWDAAKEAVSYTVYWCKRSLDGECEVAVELQWIPSNYTTNVMMFSEELGGSPLDLIYAVSAETVYNTSMVTNSSISSGMTWSRCTFVAEREPAVPLGLIVIRVNNYHVLLKWKQPLCDNSGHFDAFIIDVCKSTETDCDEWTQLVKLNYTSTAYSIRNPEPEICYKFRIKSVSRYGLVSDYSFTDDCISLANSGLPLLEMIIPLSGLLVIIVIVGIIGIFKWMKNCGEMCVPKMMITPPECLDASTVSEFKLLINKPKTEKSDYSNCVHEKSAEQNLNGDGYERVDTPPEIESPIGSRTNSYDSDSSSSSRSSSSSYIQHSKCIPCASTSSHSNSLMTLDSSDSSCGASASSIDTSRSESDTYYPLPDRIECAPPDAEGANYSCSCDFNISYDYSDAYKYILHDQMIAPALRGWKNEMLVNRCMAKFKDQEI